MDDAPPKDSNLCHPYQTWRLNFRAVAPHAVKSGQWYQLSFCVLNEFNLFRKKDLCGEYPILATVLSEEREEREEREEDCPHRQHILQHEVGKKIKFEIEQPEIILQRDNRGCARVRFVCNDDDNNSDRSIILSIRFHVNDDASLGFPRKCLPLVWRVRVYLDNAAADVAHDDDDDGEEIDETNGTGRLPFELLKRREIMFAGLPRAMMVVESPDDEIAGKVWDGGLAMVQYLCTECSDRIKGKRILELGSGTGLVGICCAMLGGSTVLTDMEGGTRLLGYNVDINAASFGLSGGSCEQQEFNWGTNIQKLFDGAKEHQNFDLLVMSDVVYEPIGYEPLLSSIVELLAISPATTTVIMAHRSRHPDEQQFFMEAEKRLDVKKVRFDFSKLMYPCNDVVIFEMRKRD